MDSSTEFLLPDFDSLRAGAVHFVVQFLQELSALLGGQLPLQLLQR
jgi:hypothetical protein